MSRRLHPTISVIIPLSPEAVLTEEWCRDELEGISHEIIIAPDWRTGYLGTKGEFVCFMERDATLSKGYFKELLKVYRENPTFRKLAMVTPTLGVNAWETKIYGYLLTSTSVMPSRIKSSSEGYLIQVGFIPGAIIRRSALGKVAPQDEDVLTESVNVSVYFWNHGQRVLIHPGVTYVSTYEKLDIPFNVDPPSLELQETMTMWKREMVG